MWGEEIRRRNIIWWPSDRRCGGRTLSERAHPTSSVGSDHSEFWLCASLRVSECDSTSLTDSRSRSKLFDFQSCKSEACFASLRVLSPQKQQLSNALIPRTRSL